MIRPEPDRPEKQAAGRALLLRRDAEKIAGALPPLLAEAQQLAQVVLTGLHGRRRPGNGEDFWQFRQAIPGDSAAAIDWRRSARSDGLFIRELEVEAAQTVQIWADSSRSMDYKGQSAHHSKSERAKLLALSLAILLNQGGERTSLLNSTVAEPRNGETQIQRMAFFLGAKASAAPDYGMPPKGLLVASSKAVFLSDFLGPQDSLLATLSHAAEQGVGGCLVQILDEYEETFPFDGRIVFESMAGTLKFETQRAGALRAEYLEKLENRKIMLETICQRTGWHCLFHRTNESPRKALLWLYMGIGERQ